jgi:phenylpropionate dioxygenase-like ring-hydroxylating dioxygenase large terminal subunit
MTLAVEVTMIFQKNVWYASAFPTEIDRSLRRRVIADTQVLLYRREDGTPAAIFDRCSHRFAPLSRGKLHGDVVECGYHGLRFDAEGRCVLNPHGNIKRIMHVPSYSVVERHGLVWIWLGDRSLADPQLIPDLSYMEAPGVKTVHNYLKTNFRYDILVDNLLDLSHAQYLHVGSFSGGPAARSEMTVREIGNDVLLERIQYYARSAPRDAELGDYVDQSIQIRWRPGQVMTFVVRTIASGTPFEGGHVIYFSHITTPESANGTHYFMSGTRSYAIDDPVVDETLRQLQLRVVGTEDCPILEAIHAEMNGADLMSMRPAVLSPDAGALRVRNVMKRLLQRDTVGSAQPRDRAAANG